MDYTRFDQRRYPTVSPREGYAEWSGSYDDSVVDELDRRLLRRITGIDWPRLQRVADLACGTGRTGQWLKSQGVATIDGVDLTPEMLERARDKAVHDRLVCADVTATGLEAASYDLCIQSLADEHLEDLGPLYREAGRLTTAGGVFVMLGYHPYFLMNGIPTHYHRDDGSPIAIQSYVHLFSDHVAAAHECGWTLAEMHEAVIDDDWIAAKPKWTRHRHQPVSYVMVWRGECVVGGCHATP